MTLEERAGFVAELSAQYGCEALFRDFSGWDASWRTQPEMWMAELREESPESDLESLAETAATDEWRANGRGISFRAICPHRSVEGNNYFDNAQLHSLLTETFFADHQGRAWANLNPTER